MERTLWLDDRPYRSPPPKPGDAVALRGPGLIHLGLLVLIATPISRVAFSVPTFLYGRDWKYVVFTLVVLGLLLYSLSGHKF